MRIDRAIFGDVQQFLRRLDELAPDGEFDGLLARGTVIFEALANLTSRDVLALLAVEDDEARR